MIAWLAHFQRVIGVALSLEQAFQCGELVAFLVFYSDDFSYKRLPMTDAVGQHRMVMLAVDIKALSCGALRDGYALSSA
ncbi:hypothetical protein KUT87_29695, partial [Pseudomonas aeruginosa]|nr:hypothetical protein [Pseudomonas aeruginosa]